VITKFQSQTNPNISVDCVIFGFDGSNLKVLLLQRAGRDNLDIDDPTMVLPGDLILDYEDLDEAASRILFELTGIKDLYLEQIGAFGHPDRLAKALDRKWLNAIRLEPNARVITVGYFALVNVDDYKLRPSGFAKFAEWKDFREVGELGFDHNEILDKAIDKLRNKLYREPVGFELLPAHFSLHQLLSLYKEIMNSDIDKRNFRRKMLKTGFIQETEHFQAGVPHKPARLYSFVREEFDNIKQQKFKFY
jgi:8-oxo-dGTP diphosphatase